jgi:hypothetical protein
MSIYRTTDSIEKYVISNKIDYLSGSYCLFLSRTVMQTSLLTTNFQSDDTAHDLCSSSVILNEDSHAYLRCAQHLL